jgi:hypothetical protein
MSKTKSAPSDPLATLLAMPLRQRIAAVARDVEFRADTFFPIDAFDLANALDVPQPEIPSSSDWTFTLYAESLSLEEYFENSGETEVFDMLASWVDVLRAAVLRERFAELDEDAAEPSFDFLTAKERAYVETRIAELAVKPEEDEALVRIANYAVKDGRIALNFEAELNDAGVTVVLRTPYDHRDGLCLGSPGVRH